MRGITLLQFLKRSALVLASAAALGPALLWITTPRLSAVSPDGRLTARVRAQSTLITFLCLFGEMEETFGKYSYVHVELTDNATGETKAVYRKRQPHDAWEDWSDPEAITWTDSWHFECRYASGLGAHPEHVFSVQRHPLGAMVFGDIGGIP
jgi:hypothetical protein